ncbi:hypothetical protein BP6252_03733 [Coleophoma cylindrospora]|uniref:Uncharacterized protein n=1 Tax=Coleophoma cylindrospora TaxID=1849047 RepID=A0A3D8S8Z6_9HELO|nr:hypothetical protein BP6252_03733 [Coleophoma cylindrospora]
MFSKRTFPGGVYIKSLYDRIEELNSIISEQKLKVEKENVDGLALDSDHSSARHIVASQHGHSISLSPSPPALVAFSVVTGLLAGGCAVKPPSLLVGPGSTASYDYAKIDRSIIAPQIIRECLAHFDRSVRPLYPFPFSTFGTASETSSLKHLTELNRFRVLIACAIAAAHRSYHDPSWRIISRACREWAEELAVPIIAGRDGHAVTALLLLMVYEFVDPERAIIWDLLGFAIRLSLELGWHHFSETTSCLPELEDLTAEDEFSETQKRQLMSILRSLERPLSIVFQRPSMLNGCNNTYLSVPDKAFNLYIMVSTVLFEHTVGPASETCPSSTQIRPLITSLEDFQEYDQLVLQAWLLFLPICVEHLHCDRCSMTSSHPGLSDIMVLQSAVLDAAVQILQTTHVVVRSDKAFIPPFIACCNAFAAGCVLLIGIVKGWPNADGHVGSLMKCSEIITFCAPLWRGGKEFHEVWQRISEAL